MKSGTKKGCLRSGEPSEIQTLGICPKKAGSLNRTKNDAKKDAAHQIGGYGDKSNTLKGELTPKLGGVIATCGKAYF